MKKGILEEALKGRVPEGDIILYHRDSGSEDRGGEENPLSS